MAETALCPACGLEVPPGATHCPRDQTPVGATADSGKTFLRPGSAEIPFTDPEPPAKVTHSLIGTKLGEFQVTQLLGEGGMGYVYRGFQPLIGKQVAIKILKDEIARDPVQMQRLLAEARAVNAIRHRGIVDIFSFGELPDGRQYLVMELLDGVPLDRMLAETHPFPLADTLFIIDEVLDALGAAHRVGVIHRDLKPSNTFLVSPPHSARYVKLLDFGLAKQAALPGGSTPQTHAASLIGTPDYMAPEQARGEAVSPATDLYALGAMLFEMLTGRVPFGGSTPFEVIAKHITEAPPRVASLAPDVPPALDALVASLLEKDPKKRPSLTEAVRAEIREVRAAASERARHSRTTPLNGDSKSLPRPRPEPVPSPERVPGASRGKVWIGIGAAAVVIAGIGIAVASQAGHPPKSVVPVPPPVAPAVVSPAPKPTQAPAPAVSAKAHLSVDSAVPCELSLDDKPVGKTPLASAEVAPGNHRLSCRSAFGSVVEAAVSVAPGGSEQRRLEFPTGTLEVWVIPYATVSIDGRKYGDTPIAPTSLVEGTHRVELVMDAKRVVRAVKVRPNETAKLRVNMEAP